MNALADTQLLKRFEAEQNGVFSKGDLQMIFGEPHPAAFVRRINTLIEHGILRRFCRGWYITETFDLATMSQRLAPESYISFGTVLARNLIIGTHSERRIIAVKLGRPRKYACDGNIIEHVGIRKGLLFGFSEVGGIRYASAEKALLDTLYFHLRGQRYPFDIYSDIAFDKLDKTPIQEDLGRYRNPRFRAFVNGILEPKMSDSAG